MILVGDNMIINYYSLLAKYSSYSNPKMKISRDVKAGKYFLLKRGIYETDRNINPMYLASSIYGPSYISFEYALYYYGLIPESVNVITNATYNKRKNKEYHNIFATYRYSDVPKEVFPLATNLVVSHDGKYSYFIASKEKCICDTLFKAPSLKNTKDLETYLFIDLRIDQELFDELDFTSIVEIAKAYKRNNHLLLIAYLKEKGYAQ